VGNLKNIDFQLDMINQKMQNAGTLVKDDTNANKLKIRLTKGNKAYDLTDATNVNAQIKGLEFIDSQVCIIEDAINGVISFVLPNITIDERMTYTGEIQVYISTTRLTSSLFKYRIRSLL